MSVALLLITHKQIATSLMEVASNIVNDDPDNFACVEVHMDTPVEVVESAISEKLDKLDQSDGVLILTDMYGGTPSNIANKFAQQDNIRMVSGLNLPMLVKTMNYRDLPLDELSNKILSGGKQSISLFTD